MIKALATMENARIASRNTWTDKPAQTGLQRAMMDRARRRFRVMFSDSPSCDSLFPETLSQAISGVLTQERIRELIDRAGPPVCNALRSEPCDPECEDFGLCEQSITDTEDREDLRAIRDRADESVEKWDDIKQDLDL